MRICPFFTLNSFLFSLMLVTVASVIPYFDGVKNFTRSPSCMLSPYLSFADVSCSDFALVLLIGVVGGVSVPSDADSKPSFSSVCVFLVLISSSTILDCSAVAASSSDNFAIAFSRSCSVTQTSSPMFSDFDTSLHGNERKVSMELSENWFSEREI